MSGWTRALVLIACLVLAFICYSVGVTAGFALFMLAGFLFEAAFWIGLFIRLRRTVDH